MNEGEQTILTAVNGIHEKIDSKSEDTHKRIDKLVESVGEVQVSVGELKVTLVGVKEDVNGHLKDHKQSGRDVFRGVLTTVFTVGGIILATWIVYEAGWR